MPGAAIDGQRRCRGSRPRPDAHRRFIPPRETNPYRDRGSRFIPCHRVNSTAPGHCRGRRDGAAPSQEPRWLWHRARAAAARAQPKSLRKTNQGCSREKHRAVKIPPSGTSRCFGGKEGKYMILRLSPGRRGRGRRQKRGWKMGKKGRSRPHAGLGFRQPGLALEAAGAGNPLGTAGRRDGRWERHRRAPASVGRRAPQPPPRSPSGTAAIPAPLLPSTARGHPQKPPRQSPSRRSRLPLPTQSRGRARCHAPVRASRGSRRAARSAVHRRSKTQQ